MRAVIFLYVDFPREAGHFCTAFWLVCPFVCAMVVVKPAV